MSLQIDLKYVHLISPRFEKFQRKHDYLFNCRCPLCGDSKKNKTKMRGYIYRKGNDLFYKCYNCSAGTTIGNLIKQLDIGLHKEYIMERYKAGEMGNANYQKPTFNIPAPRFDTLSVDDKYENAIRCDHLSDEHFCIDYLKRRDIPKHFYKLMYYTDNYKKFADEVYPNHGKEKITEDKRLVIPFYDKYNALIAISGRALEQSEYKLRYITIRTNLDESKLIYGMDRVDLSKPVYVVEGPIDSLFLDNCVASGDANLSVVANNIEAETILIWDNEPRNKDIVKMMQSAITDTRSVVIWPDSVLGKDINEMIANGLSKDEVQTIISNNTFSGLQAQLKFNYWKKI